MSPWYCGGADLIFRQHVKNKRHKYGVKFFELTTFDGYVLNIDIYSGKDDADVNDLGKTAQVFLSLMSEYLDKGYHVYADNYYNSFYLAKHLLGRKTYVSGTLRKDRKGNPTQVMNKRLKKGEVAWMTRDNISVVKWKDKRCHCN